MALYLTKQATDGTMPRSVVPNLFVAKTLRIRLRVPSNLQKSVADANSVSLSMLRH